MTISDISQAALLAQATYRDLLTEQTVLSTHLVDLDLTQGQSGDEKFTRILPVQLLLKSYAELCLSLKTDPNFMYAINQKLIQQDVYSRQALGQLMSTR